MTYAENLKQSRNKRLVPADKFDRHMKRARRIDIESRRACFCRQNESGMERHESIANIKPSYY